MIRHYLKTSINQFKRNVSFSFINLFGLATAMAVCLMIFLYVFREMGFDRFHEDANDIYRISIRLDMQGDIMKEAVTSHAMGPDILQEFPEVLEMTRISHWYEPVSLWLEDDRHRIVTNGLYAESSFFDVFSFTLLRGNPQTVLADPFSIVLTETLANELFPESDPIGKVLRIGSRQQPYRITGIVEDCPVNSHIRYNLLRSYPSLQGSSSANFYEWDANINAMTYVKLAPGSDIALLKEKTKELTDAKVNYKFEGMGVNLQLDYFPITDIRLRSPFSGEMVEAGTLSKVWILSVVALFVLFIAGFNYVNLTIAKSGKRAREVGLRKVMGANKGGLARQFYVETLLTTGVSFIIGLLLVEVSLPLFNQILDGRLSLADTPWWSWLLIFIVFIGVFGMLAGLYPAWYMASFQPVKILKGEFWSKPGRFQPRNLLLILQFTVSMALIACTLVVMLQIRYLHSKDLGFKNQGVIVVEADNKEDANLLMNALEAYRWTGAQSIGSDFPGGRQYMEGVEIENMDIGFMTHRLWVDSRYKNALELKLAEGEWFSGDSEFETQYAVVNEAFIRRTTWNNPIGKTITRAGVDYKVKGIVEDFHHTSLHHEIEPMMINILMARPGYLERPFWVVTNYAEIPEGEVVLTLGSIWQDLFPAKPLNYHFLSEHLEQQYANERSFGTIFLSFTLLAIIIAMLGVLGLAAFAAQQKQKETGIRKVLGASVLSILFRMSVSFSIYVLIAALIALPLAYLYMDKWLAGFAYAIDFPFWTPFAALGGMLILAMGIVLIQSYRTASINPVRSLSYE